MRRTFLILCAATIMLAACQTTQPSKPTRTEKTQIVLDAEQFRTIRPEILEQSGYCGRSEGAVWKDGYSIAIIVLMIADMECAIDEDEITVGALIDKVGWLKNANTHPEGKPVLVRKLNTPVWIHFLRRDDRPCILFNFGVGYSGDPLYEATEHIIGVYCNGRSRDISPEEANAFLQSVHIKNLQQRE